MLQTLKSQLDELLQARQIDLSMVVTKSSSFDSAPKPKKKQALFSISDEID